MCQIIKDRQPDVVLLDLIMPKMDGLTVMEQVNKQEICRQKTVFYSAYCCRTGKKITEDAFNKGANYYIMKPFNHTILLDRIKSIPKKSRRIFGKAKMKRVYRKFHQDGKIWKAE